MRRGPKKTPPLEYARAAYWVCNLSYISGMSFTKLERLLTPWVIKERDIGGLLQPYAFKKYATGQRTPKTEGDRSPVNIAEKYFPGSIEAYRSILWDVISLEPCDISRADLKDISRRANPELIKQLEDKFFIHKSMPILNQIGKARVLAIKHIDAFALLLLTIRVSEAITFQDVHDLRSWLLVNIKYPPLSICSDLLLGIFEDAIPELGVMTGLIGNEKNFLTNSLVAALTSGRAIKWSGD